MLYKLLIMEENKNYTMGTNNTYVSTTTLDVNVENGQKSSFNAQKILEQRMYVFVERHLSPIDKGIQSAHAVVEYSNKFSKNENYYQWAFYDKTLILLNGGVVSDLVDLTKTLYENEIPFSSFNEIDMNNMLTSVAVLIDERVFNKDEYPDFDIWRNDKYPVRPMHCMAVIGNFDHDPNDYTYNEHYKEWTEDVMGGEKNVVLRKIINSKRLAS